MKNLEHKYKESLAKSQMLLKKLNDQRWQHTIETIEDKFKQLTGKVLVKGYGEGTIWCFKIADVEQTHYINGSGAFGQWDKRRYFRVTTSGFSYTTKSQYHSSNNVTLTNESQLGLPLQVGEKWQSAYKRYLSTGTIRQETTTEIVGEDAYALKDARAALSAYHDFFKYTYFAPEGLFEDLQTTYHKQIALNEELRDKWTNKKVLDVSLKIVL